MPGCYPRLFALVLMGVGCSLAALPARADGPAETIQQAVREATFQDFEKALELFEEARGASDPQSETWAQATFGAAVCSQHQVPVEKPDIDLAQQLYGELLAKQPNSPFSARAMLNLGRIRELSDYYRDPADPAGAREIYQNLLQTYPGDPIAGEVALRIAGTYIQSFDLDQVRQGVAYLEKWLADHPEDSLASTMWQYLGDTYFLPLGDYRKSVDAYEKVDGLGWVEKGNQGPVYWRIAQVADRYLGDRAVAVKYYTKIINETPTSGKAYESQRALERLGAPVPPIALFEAFNEPATTMPSTVPATVPPAAEGSR